MKGYVRISSAAKYVDVSKGTIRSWIKDGLKSTKVRGVILIRITDIDDFINQFSDDHDKNK